MHLQNPLFAENETEIEDDWSRTSNPPEPSAPSESDLILHSNNNGFLAHDDTYHPRSSIGRQSPPLQGTVELPPALPVAVLEASQIDSRSPVLLYDYQQDRVVTMMSTLVTNGQVVESESTDFIPLMRNQSENSFEKHQASEKESTVLASGVAGAVVGTLLLGTFPGLMAGLFAAYVHDQSGAAGDISRALGEIALITREKVVVIETKHNLVARAKVAFVKAWKYAIQLDQDHNIVRKLKNFSRFSWSMILEYMSSNNSALHSRPNQFSTRQSQPTLTTTPTTTSGRRQERDNQGESGYRRAIS